jgi:hypothetical protein
MQFGSTLGTWILESVGGNEIAVHWRSDPVYILPYFVIFIIIIVVIIITCLFFLFFFSSAVQED